MTSVQPHRWVFSRIGGFDQARLQTKEDLLHLGELDQKLWAALSCPVQGLEFDERMLGLIDSDDDGRVRAPEVIAAVEWAAKVLCDPAILLEPAPFLPLSAFNQQTKEGAALLASAREILKALGKSDAVDISLEDTADQRAIFANTPFNGDGVVQQDATDDPALQAVIQEIIETQGAATDLSGKPGFTSARVMSFFAELKARSAWQAMASADILPLGENSAAAFMALENVRVKLDDFFSRGKLAQFDARAIDYLNKPLWSIDNLGLKDLSASCNEVQSLPLALLDMDNRLPLEEGLNPAWAPDIAYFRAKVITPLLGDSKSLGLAQWEQIKAIFDPYLRWTRAEEGVSVANLSAERIAELLSGSYQQALENLIAQDLALAPQVMAFAEVSKILSYRQNLKRLLNNFVNFTEFYAAKGQAIFQVGTLYLDGRACELCIRVDDPAQHAKLAGLSKCFLAYCDLRRPSGEKMTIVAAFTAGDSDYLLVGRNGLFYDRHGRDWDATIVKLIENPIGISEAFFAPYKRLVRFIEGQVTKGATAADVANNTLLEKTVDPVDPTKPAAPAPVKPKFDIGIVAALGVAVGGITTAIGMMLQAFFGLGWLMPLGLVGLILLISGPSMFIAWLKIRQRNLGPILDASGWAVNGRIKINMPFGHKLTQVAKLPAGSSRTLIDPYEEEGKPWGTWIALGLLIVVIFLTSVYRVKHNYWPWQMRPSPVDVVTKPVAPAAKP